MHVLNSVNIGYECVLLSVIYVHISREGIVTILPCSILTYCMFSVNSDIFKPFKHTLTPIPYFKNDVWNNSSSQTRGRNGYCLYCMLTILMFQCTENIRLDIGRLQWMDHKSQVHINNCQYTIYAGTIIGITKSRR